MADDNSSVDLMASTGVNDASSPWNGLLQTALQTGVHVGQDELNKALNLQTPLPVSAGAPGQAPAAAAPAKSTTNYLPWIIGAVVLLVAAFFFVRE
jgi:hypothetical protein